MEITYLRPIPASVDEITVTAAFESQQDRELIFVAEVLRDEDTKLATARSVNVLLKRDA
jgi:acyl-CoA thioesterase FadM